MRNKDLFEENQDLKRQLEIKNLIIEKMYKTINLYMNLQTNIEIIAPKDSIFILKNGGSK